MAAAPPPYQAATDPQVGYAPQPPIYPAGAQQQPRYPQQTVPNYGSYQPVGHHATHNTTVVVAQPNAAPAVTLVQRKPDNYIALSIFTLLCCCWLFGIVALIFAMQVDSAYASGDMLAAESASRSARTWNIVGIVFGCVSVAVVVIVNAIVIPVVIVSSEETYDDY